MTPTLVLLPGMDGTGDLFAPLVEHLSLPYVVLSHPTDEILAYPALLQRIRQRLPNGPFVVAAESFSGPLGAMLLEHPRLQGLVLVASFARRPRPIPAWFARLVAPWMFRIPPPTFALRLALAGGASAALVETLRASIRRVSPAVLAARLVEVLTVDVRDRLDATAKPILYLQGRRDRLVPKRAARDLPGVPVHSIDAPHLVLQTAPAACARALEDFVASLRTRVGE